MKKLRIGLLLGVIIMFGVLAVPAQAAELPDSDPLIESKRVYQNLLEMGDRLIVIKANIPYATIPDDPVTDVFIWQLIDTDGTTVLGSTTGWGYVNAGFGYNVFSLYFGADDGLAWGSAYTLRLIGNPLAFDDPPVYDYTLTAADYLSVSTPEAVRLQLADDVLVIAKDLDVKWALGVSLITEDETGQTLSAFGQAFFRGAIYSIQSLAPTLFPLAVRNIEIGDREWDETYARELQDQYDGTWIATAKAAGGALFGVDYDLLSLILLLALIVGVICANVILTNNVWDGLVDAALVAVIAAKISLFDLGYLAIIEALCIIYIGMRIWGIARG